MTLRLLHCDALPPQPWKNGGGITRELLAWPAADDWALRISVADIRADGPFSAYPGIARWFAVLQGGGVRLALPEGERSVREGDAPLGFAGEAAPACALLAGATRDLNLMVRRDAGRATMRLARAAEPWAPGAGWRALFAADALTLQVDGAEALALAAFTLAWDDAATAPHWRIAAAPPSAAAPRAYWMHFEPRTA
jgi:hypothetical protein